MRLILTPEEAEGYRGLPKDVILQRYMVKHRSEKCPYCHRLVGNHALKAFRACVAVEQAEVQTGSSTPLQEIIDDVISRGSLIVE